MFFSNNDKSNIPSVDMGISGLSRHLQPYAVSTVVGCQTPNCQKHRSRDAVQTNKIIVDGPSFAYCVYQRLCSQMLRSINAIEAMPSYNDIGKGALAFLHQLESYGMVV